MIFVGGRDIEKDRVFILRCFGPDQADDAAML